MQKFPVATGFRGFNLPQKSVIVLITDGEPLSTTVAKANADLLKNKGNTIVTVGVTKGLNFEAVTDIASEGSAFSVNTFDELVLGNVANSVLQVVLPGYVRDACPGGFMYNLADPAVGRTVSSVVEMRPGLMTAEACAEVCASVYTGQNGKALCQGFSFQQVSTAGLGVCRLGSSAESAAVPALQTCAGLGWEVFAASENQAVCGTHQYTDAVPCDFDVGKQTFAEAVVACDSAGARLCTADELQSNVAVGDGCDFKNDLFLWSSGECAGGTKFELAKGSKQDPAVDPLCRLSTGTRHIRCCADVSVSAADAAAYASTFRYYRCVERGRCL